MGDAWFRVVSSGNFLLIAQCHWDIRHTIYAQPGKPGMFSLSGNSCGCYTFSYIQLSFSLLLFQNTTFVISFKKDPLSLQISLLLWSLSLLAVVVVATFNVPLTYSACLRPAPTPTELGFGLRKISGFKYWMLHCVHHLRCLSAVWLWTACSSLQTPPLCWHRAIRSFGSTYSHTFCLHLSFWKRSWLYSGNGCREMTPCTCPRSL